jgi:predicted nucleic acid-binding protein
MNVVGDTSPFIVLVNIHEIDLLPALFGEVVVPPEVIEELGRPHRPPAVQNFVRSIPAWLRVRTPRQLKPGLGLHDGERAAISLAVELKPSLLLIDEKLGRAVAQDLKIDFIGAVGILKRAADRRLVDLGDAFSRMKATDFWISHRFLDDTLRGFQARRSH